MPVRELLADELIVPKSTKSNIRELSGDELIKEPSFFEETAGQAIAGVQDFSKFLVTPIRATVGEVVYTPGQGFEHIGPDEAFRREEAGELDFPGAATEEPTSILGKGSRFAGQVLGAGPILGRAFGFVKAPKIVKDASRLSKLRQAPRRAISEAGERFRQAPIKTTLVEGGLGFTAGVGGGIGEEVVPDSDASRLVGEVIGGVLPQLMPVALAVKASSALKNMFHTKFILPLTEKGGTARARARVTRAIPTDSRGKVLEEIELPTTLDPATGQPVLTPAQRTGVPGLMSLEKSIMSSREELVRESDSQIAHANKVIQESIDDLGDASTSVVSDNIEVANKYMDTLLDSRVRIASQRTAERVEGLGPSVTREQSNRIAREEIEGALDAARTQENELYSLIDPEIEAPITNTLSLLKGFKKELGKAQLKDIPSDEAKIILEFGEKGVTTIKELRSIQSALRAVARNARAGDIKNLNKARISDDLANAITDDLAESQGGPVMADNIQTAIAFSRNLNDRFSQGTVGKILGRKATGGERVPAGLTLEESIGVTGPKAREGLDDILKAFDSPEAPGSSIIVNSSEDYLRSRFLKSAVHRGQLNVKSAERFIKQNDEILGRLPNLRNQIDEVIESGDALAITERQRSKISLDDPKVSKATMLIERGPIDTFKQIARLNAKSASKEMQLLINRVAKDETGEALEGLKSGFVEFLLSGARSTSRDITGLPFLSGFGLKEAIDNPSTKAMISKLFTKAEQERMTIIAQDLIRVEQRRTAQVAPEGILGDKPSKLVETIAGIVGASVGRSQAQRLGLGGTIQIPGIVASRFRDMATARIKDPAGRLLRDAVNDEVLFKELLEQPVSAAGELTPIATRRLNIWSYNVLQDYGGTIDGNENLDEE